MGRQINFFQLHDDVMKLCEYLYSNDIVIFNYRGLLIEDWRNIDFQGEKKTPEKIIGNYFIANRTTIWDKSEADIYCYPNFYDQVIEFCPSHLSCSRINFFNNGRFYFSNELYDNNEMLLLYKVLVKYIKKNYIYSKESGFYIAPNFFKEYKSKKVFPCNFDNLIDL